MVGRRGYTQKAMKMPSSIQPLQMCWLSNWKALNTP